MKRKSILLAAMVLFLCACPATGIILNDGLTHDIDYEVLDDIQVDYQTPNMYTTVNVLAGAYIDYIYNLCGYENSRINVLGGCTRNLYIYDSSKTDFSSGRVDVIRSYNSSQVDMSGGGSLALYSFNSSQVDISGGSIYRYLKISDSSQVSISGGEIRGLTSLNSGKVNISGGMIGGDLILYNESLIQIYGSNFAVNGHDVGYGELTNRSGHLTGTLLSGEFIDNDFYIGEGASIVLVPEPTTLLLLGLGGLFLRKKRKV